VDAHLERVLLAADEREPEHLLETRRLDSQVPVRVDLVDVLVAQLILGPEGAEVADVEDAVVRERRRDDVALARRHVDEA
jgi:hypothetical protein